MVAKPYSHHYWWLLGQKELHKSVSIGEDSRSHVSHYGAGVGRIGLLDGFWVMAFPKSCSGSLCILLMVAVAMRSDGT